jgi:hypothetical protein
VKKRDQPVKAWGGFNMGELGLSYCACRGYYNLAIFRTRRAALLLYEDVRRVEIREAPKRRTGDKP